MPTPSLRDAGILASMSVARVYPLERALRDNPSGFDHLLMLACTLSRHPDIFERYQHRCAISWWMSINTRTWPVHMCIS